MKPQPTDYASYYQPYIDKVTNNNLLNELTSAQQQFAQYLNRINEQQAVFRYQPDKWSIKEIVQHLIDCERIFAYRALSIARLPQSCGSFDQNKYVLTSNADYRNWLALTDEMEALRTSTTHLFQSFNTNMLSQRGEMADSPVTVNAIGFIIAGHQIHHNQVIKELYLPKLT